MNKQVVVVAGPSGSGKDAIVRSILEQCRNCTRLVTATTRLARPNERDGVDYYFFDMDRFDREMIMGNILEHRYVPHLDTHYGIYKPELERRLQAGGIVFAVVDVIGARFLKQTYGATTIFVMPESIEQFRGRLHVRNPEWTDKELQTRMKIAQDEIRMHSGEYDHRVINADGFLPRTVAEVLDILRREGYAL